MLVIPCMSKHDASMIRNLDIGLLRAFVVVADHRSMTAAARRLHLTQGAISQQIARLEALAGGKLLARDRRGISLTPFGERLLGRVRQLLALHDEIWADIEGGTVAGPVRLGAPYDLVGSCLVSSLRAFGGACPRVDLSLVCGSSPDLTRALAGGRLDVAVLEEPVACMTGECLAVDRLVWVGAKGGRAYSRIPLPVSMVAETCAFRPAVLAALKRQHREWRAVFENGNMDSAFAAVRADLAVTACLAATVPAGLDVLPPETGLPRLPPFAVTLHVSGGPASPATSELARHMRDALKRPRQVA